MRERQDKTEATLRDPLGPVSSPPRRKMGNGTTGPTKPSMGDGAPTTPKTNLSRASARNTSRTM
jgi:hypothetical protein